MPSRPQAVSAISEITVLWITAGLGCDGESVAITAATQPSIEDLVLGALPGLPKVNFHNPFYAYENGAEFIALLERAGQLGKHVIESQDRAGFVVNALLIPYILSAIRMLESGFATAEHIDDGMVQGCAHPMGPLALADLIGLDTVLAILRVLHDGFADPKYRPCPLLVKLVDAGRLGRKAGRGFHSYA